MASAALLRRATAALDGGEVQQAVRAAEGQPVKRLLLVTMYVAVYLLLVGIGAAWWINALAAVALIGVLVAVVPTRVLASDGRRVHVLDRPLLPWEPLRLLDSVDATRIGRTDPGVVAERWQIGERSIVVARASRPTLMGWMTRRP